MILSTMKFSSSASNQGTPLVEVDETRRPLNASPSIEMDEACSLGNAIELQDIEKTYLVGESEVAILKKINLTIEIGEFVALMGPSGSGKSTLMNIVGCLDRPTRGRFLLYGQDVGEKTEDELAGIRSRELGFIFQTFNLINRISVLKNVELPMALSGIPRGQRRAKAEELLKAVGLEHRTEYSPLLLSGGERQRVAIARALANDPKIIIADEPTGSLDLKSSNEVMSIMEKLNHEGRTIIMVTHNPEITESCSRVIRLRDGRIVEMAA
jgi:putative ABC transport system ATP-binding protein